MPSVDHRHRKPGGRLAERVLVEARRREDDAVDDILELSKGLPLGRVGLAGVDQQLHEARRAQLLLRRPDDVEVERICHVWHQERHESLSLARRGALL